MQRSNQSNEKSRRYWCIMFIIWFSVFSALTQVPSIMFGISGWANLAIGFAIACAGMKWFILPCFIKMAPPPPDRDAS